MRVSVLIVNWNGRDLLPGCLAALARQTVAPHEIVVVDNGSEDGSADYLRECDAQGLKTRFLGTNTGFSGGNNVAFGMAEGDVVALLNNDAEPDPDWIAEALPAFEDPAVAMVACKVLRAEGGTVDKVGHLMYRDGQNRGRGTGRPDDGRFDTDEEALWPDGCAGFYRRSALEQTLTDGHLLDPDFFLYAEDAELGMRLRWAGYRCIYRHKSVVTHRHSAGLGKFGLRKLYFIERNRMWLLVKTFPLGWILVSPWFTLLRHGANALAALRGRGVAGGAARAQSPFALAGCLVRALWDGLRGAPRMWRKRSGVVKRVSDRDMKRILRTYRISLSELTGED